ncbi:MAG: hypothetical protein H7A01_05720 [Hahellaceae bacterium]|jgi:hypothetical protein|nr:hypothetical protein [Hahellaceae bacterium]MCP5212915.1 hypothetical protein [Hahellaceae bacterium]
MSAPVIITIIVVIIAVSIALIFIGQARERAKIERIRRANTLQDRCRRLKRLTTDLPPQYLAKELKILIIERSIDTLNELKQLQKADFKHGATLQDEESSLELLKQSTEKPQAVPIVDEVQAKEVQGLLEALQKFVEAQRKKGNIDNASAKKHIQHITYYAAKSKADYYANKAKANIQLKKWRLAIHQYHSAIAELEPLKALTVAQKAIQAYKVRIKELDNLAEEEKKVAAAKPEEKPDEWKSFIGDDDQWKKKNAYDD